MAGLKELYKVSLEIKEALISFYYADNCVLGFIRRNYYKNGAYYDFILAIYVFNENWPTTTSYVYRFNNLVA